MKNFLYSVALFAASPVVLADVGQPVEPVVMIKLTELDQSIKQFQMSVSAQISADIRQQVQDNIRHSLSR
jgi:hypothetical protein